jgi:hypothetical protein
MCQSTSVKVVGFLISIGMLSIYTITYNSVDSFVYYVPVLPLFIPFLAYGMEWLSERGIAGFLLLLLPVMLLVSQWQTISLTNDTAVKSWLQYTTNQTPTDSVLVSHDDKHTFALWYAQEILGFREDVIVIDERLWAYPPYQRFVSDTIGESHVNIQEIASDRTLCVVGDKGVMCQ